MRQKLHIKKGLVALAFIITSVGCIGNPVPEPPNNRPDPVNPCDIFETGVESVEPREISSNVGSIDPNYDVYIWNLENRDSPSISGVRIDGSFSTFINAQFGDELRIQARSSDSRSVPVDAILSTTSSYLVPSENSQCLDVPVELFLERSPEGAFQFSHQCSEEVNFVNMRFRVGDSSWFSFDSVEFGFVQPGESVEVNVRDIQGGPGEREHILFLEFEIGGSPERRAVSITTESF